MTRYRVGDSVKEFGPPFAVLDDRAREAIALCWHKDKAQVIVDALNGTLVDFGELRGASGDAFLGGMLGSFAGTMLERRLRQLPGAHKMEPPAPGKKIPKGQQHRWKELHGLGGGWTCVRCKKSAADCRDRERFYCSASTTKGAK